MKKLILLVSLAALSFSAKAQWIDSLVVSPALPDANDTVRIYAYLTFPQGNCEGVASGSLTGNTIYASTLHCMGAAMFICNDVDTLVFPPMNAGGYILFFTLSSGYGIPNCTPGFQADDVDTLTFQVFPALDVPAYSIPELKVSPNPTNGNFSVQISSGTIERVEIINTLGEVVFNTSPENSLAEINANDVATGLYFCRIIDSNGQIFVQQMEILH